MNKRRVRRPVPRLICSEETLNAVETALPDQVARSARMVTKTQLADALVLIALRHPDEVARALKAGTDHVIEELDSLTPTDQGDDR